MHSIQRLKNATDWEEAIAEIGQGNSAGPHIWALVSTVLFKMMREDGFFAKLVCAMSVKELKLARFAFIDDMTYTPEDEEVIPKKCNEQWITGWGYCEHQAAC